MNRRRKQHKRQTYPSLWSLCVRSSSLGRPLLKKAWPRNPIVHSWTILSSWDRLDSRVFATTNGESHSHWPDYCSLKPWMLTQPVVLFIKIRSRRIDSVLLWPRKVYGNLLLQKSLQKSPQNCLKRNARVNQGSFYLLPEKAKIMKTIMRLHFDSKRTFPHLWTTVDAPRFHDWDTEIEIVKREWEIKDGMTPSQRMPKLRESRKQQKKCCEKECFVLLTEKRR